MIRRPPRSPLFPSPTLFRSALTTVGGSPRRRLVPPMLDGMAAYQTRPASFDMPPFHRALAGRGDAGGNRQRSSAQIGRASGRGRGEISVVAGSFKKKKNGNDGRGVVARRTT